MRGMGKSVIQKVKINSNIIAFILCVNTFSKILSIFVVIPYNIVMMETLAITLLILSNEQIILLEKQTSSILLVVGGIMVYSLLIYRMDARVIERLLKFVMYGLFSMLCVQYSFDKKTLYKTIFIFGFIHLWYLYAYATNRIQAGLMSIDDTMDLSYTSLIYVFAGSEVVTSRGEKTLTRLLAAISCVLFVFFLVGISVNRGALISAVSYYVLRFVNKQNDTKKRIVLFACVIIIGIFAYINLISILKSIDALTTSIGMTIRPLQKTIQQMEYSDSMISGRECVYGSAMELIKESWALPNGVAGFDVLKGIYYPHNIFLEAGIEFGFIGIILVILIILRACYQMVIRRRKNTDLLLLFFCLSIPRLMVSSSYWENTFIWPMMVLMWTNSPGKTQRSCVQRICV